MTDELLFDSKYIQVRSKDDWYVYSHLKWCNGVGVAILPFQRTAEGNSFLARLEITPSHSASLELCAITGGYDNSYKFSIEECVLNELQEEGGYVINPGKLISLGTVRPYKFSDTLMHLFAAIIDNTAKEVEATGDGTKGEEGASCQWISYEELLNAKDPLLHTMALRLLASLAAK